MVEDLTRMTMERLQLYKQKNGNLPDRIIVFRDGVSEVGFAEHQDVYSGLISYGSRNTNKSSRTSSRGFKLRSSRYPPRGLTSPS